MLENLKIGKGYDGFLFLAESERNTPKLRSHHHVELELNLVVRGTITYVVGAKRFTFPARSLLWMFPEQEHQMVDCSDNAQYYVAVFKPGLITRSCRTPAYEGLKSKSYPQDGVLYASLEPDSFDLIRKTMDSLMQGSLDSDVLNREAGFGVGSDFCFEHGDPDGLNAGLHYLLMLSWRSRRFGKVFGEAVPLHPAVRRALKLLSEDDWNQDFAKLAKVCRVSEAYLSRTFRKQIGVSLSRYRNSLRLSRFWEKYRASEDKNLADAVYASGFGSYAQFYKVFTQAYGRGPRACLADGRSTDASSRLSVPVHSMSE